MTFFGDAANNMEASGYCSFPEMMYLPTDPVNDWMNMEHVYPFSCTFFRASGYLLNSWDIWCLRCTYNWSMNLLRVSKKGIQAFLISRAFLWHFGISPNASAFSSWQIRNRFPASRFHSTSGFPGRVVVFDKVWETKWRRKFPKEIMMYPGKLWQIIKEKNQEQPRSCTPPLKGMERYRLMFCTKLHQKTYGYSWMLLFLKATFAILLGFHVFFLILLGKRFQELPTSSGQYQPPVLTYDLAWTPGDFFRWRGEKEWLCCRLGSYLPKFVAESLQPLWEEGDLMEIDDSSSPKFVFMFRIEWVFHNEGTSSIFDFMGSACWFWNTFHSPLGIFHSGIP